MNLIWERMAVRSNHFMQPEMLASQFEALEPPSPRNTLIIDISLPVEQIIDHIV